MVVGLSATDPVLLMETSFRGQHENPIFTSDNMEPVFSAYHLLAPTVAINTKTQKRMIGMEAGGGNGNAIQ